MSIQGDILENLGDAVELLLAGSHAQWLAGSTNNAPMAHDAFVKGQIFELLHTLHNRATKDEIRQVLETTIYD